MKKSIAPKARKIQPLEIFTEEVIRKHRTGSAAEASYYPAIGGLIEAIDGDFEAISQPKRIQCGAPDFVVLRQGAPVGYVEVKDLGTDLSKAEDSKQLCRYRENLQNLVLTNCLEWRWYVDGNLREKVKVGSKRIRSIDFAEGSFSELEMLLNNFLQYQFESISTSHDLAKRLAASTRIVKELIARAFTLKDDQSKWLESWLKAFQQVLLSDLSIDKFADMFAQTLAYGMFAARMHIDGKSKFSRISAAHVLPKTNPFLRKLFAEFTGVSMPDVVNWAVDDLVEILKRTNIDRIKTEFANIEGKEDAIVHFYELFLQEYDPSLRQKRGVYYTPKQIVDFITRSVDEILCSHFNKKNGLADDDVLLLDPAVGTGSFLNSAIELIYSKFKKNKGLWDSYVSESLLKRMFGFEILMAPYTVSHLKIGMTLKETGHTFGSQQRLGVFLTNTLEEAAKKSEQLFWLADEANAAAKVKQEMPIMVIVGNPPYKGHSANKGKWIEGLLKGYDSLFKKPTSSYFHTNGKVLKERQKKWLHDDYVKFLRFAQWRLERTGSGVIAMVTNHAFLENPTFRAMRESLLRDFDEIYVYDLHGNSKRREGVSQGVRDQNVFQITQGVAISFLIKREQKNSEKFADVYRCDLWGTQESKYKSLEGSSFSSLTWEKIEPQEPQFIFKKTSSSKDLKAYLEMPILSDVFDVYGVGIVAGRDALAVHFSEKEAKKAVENFSHLDTEDARSEYALGDDARDWKVATAQRDIIESGTGKARFKKIMYRPFDIRYTYYTGRIKGFHCQPAKKIMDHMLNGTNLAICISKRVESGEWNHIMCSSHLLQHHSVSSKEANYVFPLKRFNVDEGGRPAFFDDQGFDYNIKSEFIDLVSRHFRKEVSADDIFAYLMAIFNANSYRARFGEYLKSDFPRIPLVKNWSDWIKLVRGGQRLIEAQTSLEDSHDESPASFPVAGSGVVKIMHYDEKRHEVWINDKQVFKGVRPHVWNFEIGRHRVCEKWLKDRKERALNVNEVRAFLGVVAAVSETINIQNEIEAVFSKAPIS